jgi:hypothetical protein
MAQRSIRACLVLEECDDGHMRAVCRTGARSSTVSLSLALFSPLVRQLARLRARTFAQVVYIPAGGFLSDRLRAGHLRP